MASDPVAAATTSDLGRAAAAPTRIQRFSLSPGTWWSIPVVVFMLAGFVGPLLIVAVFSFMPPRTFSLASAPTLSNFQTIFEQGFYRSYLWSIFLAALTVILTVLISYPLAFAMVKVFSGKFAGILVLLVSFPLLVSENIRLLGWELILVRKGILSGTLESLFGLEIEGLLFNIPVIVLGLVYIYLPFMLFPLILGLSMIPDELVGSARDLGASRFQTFREVELPLAMPGLLIGVLLTFVLSMGSVAEALVLGGRRVVMIVGDIERAFSFQQNWPLGSALSLLLIVIAGVLVWGLVSRLDMDNLLHRAED